MNRWRYAYLGALVPALALGLGLWSPLRQAVARSPNKAPRYRVVAGWPKPLPSDTESNPAAPDVGATKGWVTGEVGGTCVDSRDHLFTINRGGQANLVSPETVVAHPSPAVIEYDREGNVANAWPPNVMTATAPWWAHPQDPPGCDGSPTCHGAVRGVPTGIHGCYVDYQDNVWIGGNGNDGIIQKYSHDGSTLLLQLGIHNVCDNPPTNTCGNSGANAAANNSRTLLNQPPDITVDPGPDPVNHQRGTIYVADGYGNHRVVVFDSAGRWIRHWGGVVQNNANPNLSQHDRGSFASGDGGHPHCVVLGNDGLLYVCDRGDDRILVFEKNPSNCTNAAGTGPASPSVWVAGDTPVCQPVKIINVIPGTGVTNGQANGAPTTGLGTAGSAWDIDFSRDREQSLFFEADGGDEIVWTFDHALAMSNAPWPSAILAGFGRPGHLAGDFTFLHTLALDSKGNLFTGETINGRRVQKFEARGVVNERRLADFHPAGYPDITLKHYDPRSDDDDD
jgi:hypothetical protein